MVDESTTVDDDPIDGIQELTKREFIKAKLECMRNMGTMAAYSFGASYLINKHPRIWGTTAPSGILGSFLFLIVVWGTVSTATQFFDAVLGYLVAKNRHRWNTTFRRALIFVLLMLSFLCLSLVPWLIVFGIARE